MKCTTYISNHFTNKNTAIKVTENCLILEDDNELEIISLKDLNINKLIEIKNLTISDRSIKLGDLFIEYDNRGEPYQSGLTFTVNNVSVFLDKSDINDFIRLIEKYE